MREPYTSVQTTIATPDFASLAEELVRKWDEDRRASMITADREISVDEAPMLRRPRHPENVEPPAKPSDENDPPAADDPIASNIARASERLAAWLKHRPPADRNLVTKRVVLKAVRDELGFSGLSEKLFVSQVWPRARSLAGLPMQGKSGRRPKNNRVRD